MLTLVPPGGSPVVTDPSTRLRSAADVRGYVTRVCFKTGPPGLVGTELEWLVVDRDDPRAQVPLGWLRSLLEDAGPPPHGSRLTYEPGGQVELSSLAYRGTTACWQSLSEDAEHLRAALEPAGLALLPTALDPFRPPQRQLEHPRYDAMEAYFAAAGGESAAYGPVMMTGTAATQVNLDIGRDPCDAGRRWRVLHAVGPAMVAAFANSPVHAGDDTGWRSGRQRVWQGLDPQRTAHVAGEDPVGAWADYALDAPVMLRGGVNGDAGPDGDWAAEPGLRFRDWLARDDGPTEADLATHLTTLFPPVRPRGWFEVRYLDALPWEWWPVPMAVLTAVVEDRLAGAQASEACASLDDWTAAARDGLAGAGLREAALGCFDAALPAMTRSGEHPDLVALVAAYRERYVRPGRCPADDPLEVA